MPDSLYFIDRQTGKTQKEEVYFEGSIRFLYETKLGKFLAALLARVSLFSSLFGWWYRLGLTKRTIAPFVERYGLKSAEFELPLDAYPSFDAFFTRRLKKEARPLSKGVIIPADGRYLVYQNMHTCDGFVVKGKKFSLAQLLQNAPLAKRYAEGGMVIARLAPVDYHRFHFPVDCVPSAARLINGPLYSVSPIAVKKNIAILAENKRVITELKTDQYGTILFIEIGATNVGSIHQTYQPNRPYKKGDEKGYFSFGGSSLILLFEKDVITFAKDLVANSQNQIETLCLFGQKLEN